MIAICIPSRGLMHSRTIEDVTSALIGHPHVFVFAHGRPQPEAQNTIVGRALAWAPDYIWFVDDDMRFPDTIVEDLLLALQTHDIATADYPCTARGNNVVHIRDGIFESAGMGCVMLRPELLKRLEEPYFRTNIQWIWNGVELQPSQLPPGHDPLMRHGGHDVDFWQRLVHLDPQPSIKVIDTTVGQYYYEGSTRKYGNNTGYNVEVWECK